MALWLGDGREAQVIHIGRAHTAGDTVVWLPKEKVMFAGDTVEFGATPYCGDAHFGDQRSGVLLVAPVLGQYLANRPEIGDGHLFAHQLLQYAHDGGQR